MMVKALLTSVMMLVACAGPKAALTTQRSDFQERDEFNQTYQLAPGARVEVSSIRGSVKIMNADTATAEVQIIRTARTRADLEYHKIEVSTGAGGTDDLHFRRCGISVDDFDGATNARDLNARSGLELVRLVEFVAFLKVAPLDWLCSERCLRRSPCGQQHHHARKQCRNYHVFHLSLFVSQSD